MQEKVNKCCVMLLSQLSYIYWLIHFKANNVNGNSYIENNSTDSLKILLLLFDSFVHGTLLTRLSKLFRDKNDRFSFVSYY